MTREPIQKTKRPGRPKTLRKPTTINLSVDASVKFAFQKLAYASGKSASALLVEWVTEAGK